MATTDRLKLLLDSVLTWPPDEQARAAEALAMIEARRGEVYEPTEDEWSAIEQGLAQIEGGDIASAGELEALWKRFGP